MTGADIRWELAPVDLESALSPIGPADDALEILARSEAHLRSRVDRLEAEKSAYRTLSQQAIHALHDLTRERDRLRETMRLEREQRRAAA
jgi:hypothetical protein